MESKKTCFIITPIGSKDTPIRRKIDGIIKEVIEPVLNEFNYKLIVSHADLNSGSIKKKIIRDVYFSDLVIANLTEQNPNVMYELALRHASAKPVIHITEDIQNLPFDINDHRTIEYTNDIMGASSLKDDLRKMIAEIMSTDESISNPIVDSLEKKTLINISEKIIDYNKLIMKLQEDIAEIKEILYRDEKIDTAVKIRGFRIELEEIAKKIIENPDYKEAYIVLIEDHLHAYISTNNEMNLTTTTKLYNYLLLKLPSYMVPKYYSFMKELPRSIDGKVDIDNLPNERFIINR